MSDGFGASEIGIDDGGELDGRILLAQFAVDAGVIAPEGARSDDGDVGDFVQSNAGVSPAGLRR